MRNRYLFLGYVFVIIRVFPSCAQPHTSTNNNPLSSSIDSIMAHYIDARLIPGGVVLVKHKGQVIHEKGYGFTQVKNFADQWIENPPVATTTTIYDLASLTKVVGTTSAIMLLHDQGKLSVEDPVYKYLPAFDTPEKRSITLRHLLTHTSGLIEWYPMYYRSDNREDTYRLIESLPLKFPVGAGRHYSDLGFWLLGEIAEKVSGEPLEDFVRKHIFKPLHMDHTGFLPDTSQAIAATSLGNPYEYRMVRDSSMGFIVPGLDPDSWNGWRQYVLTGQVNDGNAWYAGRGVCGAAGIFSRLEDIQLLLDMLMHDGMVDGKPFLKPQTIQTFFTPDRFHNGLGWMMDPSNSFMKGAPAGSFGHTGFTGTSICVVPELDLDIIILINRQNVGLQPNGSYFNPNPIREGIFKAVIKEYGKL